MFLMSMLIDNLFPIPVDSIPNFITTEERLKLLDVIKRMEYSNHSALDGNAGSNHVSQCHNPIDFVDDNIKQRIQSAVDSYTEESGHAPSKLHTLWSNIQQPGSALREHCHPSSVLSGALYINVDDTCILPVHNPNPYVKFEEFYKSTRYNSYGVDLKVSNGELIIFPAWLRHGNGIVNQMIDRVVISFNTKLNKKYYY